MAQGLSFPPGAGIGTNQKLRLRNNRIVMPNATLFQSVMASPPSPTLTTSHTISSPFPFLAGAQGNTSALGGSMFSFCRAGGGIRQANSFPRNQFVAFTNINNGSFRTYCSMQASFWHDGRYLEIIAYGGGGLMALKVNDQYLSLSPTTLANDGSIYFWYFDFGSRAKRRIDFITTGSFGGVYTEQNDSIEPAPVRGPRTVVIGASFTQGTGATGGATAHWVQAFSDALGWDDVWSWGVGATGFIANNSGGSPTFGQQVADVVSYAPDCVIFDGPINDNGNSAASVAAAALAAYQAVQAALPNALIVQFAPFWKSGAEGTIQSIWQIKDALRTAVASGGGIFLDVLELPLPLGYAPMSTTMAAAKSSGSTSFSVNDIIQQAMTLKFADGTRFFVKSVTGGGFTANLDSGIQLSELINAPLTQVGGSFWTGHGRVGATTGWGNCDLYVSSDSTHPSQAGHVALGICGASLLMAAMAPN
jgi:GDSL-like lipase/acylhydrolase family protein